MRRRLTYLAAPIVLALLVSCSSAPQTDGTPGASTTPREESRGDGNEPTVTELGGPRDTLVVAFLADVDQFNTLVQQASHATNISTNIFAQTFETDFDCEITYSPYLAESWEFSPDLKKIDMKLAPGFTWYDGTPITGKDYKFTYDMIRTPVVASPRVTYIEHMDPARGPLVVDDTTLEWHFTQAYDRITMLAHVGSMPPVPEHVLRDADPGSLRGHEFSRAPLVSGPFKIDSRSKNEKLVLAPNENFTGPEQFRPRLKRVVYKIIPEYATRILELENGSADMMEQILITDADRLAKEHPEIKLYRRGWRSQDYIGWNAFDPADYKAKQKQHGKDLDWSTVKPHHIFGDKAVRRALTKAMNVQKLINDLVTSKVTGDAYGRPAVSTVTPALCATHNNDLEPLPFDVEAARAELAAAGWVDGDGDGLREKNGRKLAFTLLTNSGNSRRAKAAIIVQANLKEVGVDMKIDKLETNTFFERLRKKDYEAALAGWAAGLFVDMNTIWHSGESYEFNFVGYDNPEVDRLMEAAINEPDPDKNNAMWKQVQALIYEDQPYSFLYWMDEIVGVHERFRDVKVDILSPYQRLYTWWVPENEVKYKR